MGNLEKTNYMLCDVCYLRDFISITTCNSFLVESSQQINKGDIIPLCSNENP